MARHIPDRVVRAQQHGKPNGDLPPSTLAAQIVQSHLKHDKRSQLSDRVDFRQLLEELQTLPDVDESDVQTNYVLVTVVAQAGLEASKGNDPFNQSSVSTEEVLASLDVIELVVRQNPDVLFYEPEDVEGPGSQLSLTLLPKLFAMLRRRNDNDVVLRRVAKLLAAILLPFQQNPSRWNAFTTLLNLYRICVDGLIDRTLRIDTRTYVA